MCLVDLNTLGCNSAIYKIKIRIIYNSFYSIRRKNSWNNYRNKSMKEIRNKQILIIKIY